MKEDQERGEQETAARLKAMEASEGAWIGRLATEPTLRERLIAQFAAMSPAERALPAVLDPAQHGTSEMIAPDRPDSERLVALNPAFYASHGSADGRAGERRILPSGRPERPQQREVAASISFYERLGFVRRFGGPPGSPTYAAVVRDGVELHLQWHDAAEWTADGDRPTYRFVVEDVDGLYRELRSSGWKAPLAHRPGVREVPLAAR
jgi:hypothetical protein